MHSINKGEGGGGDVSCGHAKTAVARGPGDIGAFSAQCNDGKIVHQNPLVSSYIHVGQPRDVYFQSW